MPRQTRRLRDEILSVGFQGFNGTFASEKTSNNKLELEIIKDNPHLKPWVVARVGQLATHYNPDLLVGVPNGANWLATAVAQRLGILVALLNSNDKIFTFQPEAAKKCQRAQRIVIIEDVFTELTSTRKVLYKPQILEHAVAAVGVFNRGDQELQPDIGIPIEAVINEYIPLQLPADHKLWSIATNRALPNPA